MHKQSVRANSKGTYHLSEPGLPDQSRLKDNSTINPVSYTVYSPLFFRKIAEIERFALLPAILDEYQNYFGGGGGGGGAVWRNAKRSISAK